jgi:colicin import membrane protein
MNKTTILNKATLSGIMLAVAVLATGCHKAEDNNSNMGPAQTAGKAVDDTGAKVAAETREGADRAAAAADRANDKAAAAVDRAGDNLQQAGAEIRQDSKEAAHNAKEGVKNATEATGKAVERTGEKIQDASK